MHIYSRNMYHKIVYMQKFVILHVTIRLQRVRDFSVSGISSLLLSFGIVRA